MRGVIRPNEPYVQHFHAGVHITATSPREFIVDEKATGIVDKPGRPLVLSPAAYAEMKVKFGKQLVCEPVGGLEGAAGAAERVAELEGQLELTASALHQAQGVIEKQDVELSSARERIVKLEQQLSKASKKSAQ